MGAAKRKKIVFCISLAVLASLLICTMASSWNQKKRIPRVILTTLQPGYVDGRPYDWVLPARALHKDGEDWYAFHVEEVTGQFEDELVISESRMNVLDMDAEYAAVEEKLMDLRIVEDSNKPLEIGMRVVADE